MGSGPRTRVGRLLGRALLQIWVKLRAEPNVFIHFMFISWYQRLQQLKKKASASAISVVAGYKRQFVRSFRTSNVNAWIKPIRRHVSAHRNLVRSNILSPNLHFAPCNFFLQVAAVHGIATPTARKSQYKFVESQVLRTLAVNAAVKALSASINRGREFQSQQRPVRDRDKSAAQMAEPGRKRKQHGDETPRKRSKSGRWEDDSLLDTEVGLNRAFAGMTSQLLADHLSQKTARFGTDLSPVELSDLYISCKGLVMKEAFTC